MLDLRKEWSGLGWGGLKETDAKMERFRQKVNTGIFTQAVREKGYAFVTLKHVNVL